MSISQEDSDGTDGAMQHPVDDDEAQIYEEYYVALDTTGSSSGADLDRTMVHEFAYLLTLRTGQITPLTPEEEDSDEPVECAVYATPECPTEDVAEVFAEWVLNEGDTRTVPTTVRPATSSRAACWIRSSTSSRATPSWFR